MKAFLVVALLFAAISVLGANGANEQQFVAGVDVEQTESVDGTSDIVRSASNGVLQTKLSKAQLKQVNKAAQALGQSYLAINQALGPRTQAYVNNFLQALGYAPMIGFFRNLFASSGRLQFISFVRQYAALFGGASGYQLAQYVRAFGSPANAAQEFAAFYKELGAPLLVFLQQVTVSTGGRSSRIPANLSFAVFNANGEANTIAAVQDMLAAVGNKPKVLGALLGRVANNLNVNNFINLVANQLAGAVTVVEAAAAGQAIPAFDFSSLPTTTFDVTGAANIIISAVKQANYF